MANPGQKLDGNVPGVWFVDRSCIDCDACRQIAPEIFGEVEAGSVVRKQPERPEEEIASYRALVACPVGAIGLDGARAEVPKGLFPQPIDEAAGVFYCGFNSEDSFGGNSFFVARPEGGFLVDAPRWAGQLVRELESLGGISDILLTHRDDVAAARRYQEHFGARVWIHEEDRRAAPFATDVFRGEETHAIRSGLLAIPVPGHTRGSAMFLLDDRFLFSGDSLYWRRDREELGASRTYCWYSWEEQVNSLDRLTRFRFEWVLAGHGDRARRPAAAMRHLLEKLVRDARRG